ncbi:MAG: septum formation initiator family protein [Verrucomicrobiota bacterium]|nr:septum formation initiator family protein [Verrucomicrobiota bacterium]
MAGNSRNRTQSKLHLIRPGEGVVNFMELLTKAVVLSIAAAVIVLTFVIFAPIIKNVHTYQQTVDNKKLILSSEIEKMKLLTREVELLRTDRDYNERVAREKLGLAKPNETIFRFPPLGQKQTARVIEGPTASAAR